MTCRLCDAPSHLHNNLLPDKHDAGCPRGVVADRFTFKPGHEEEDHDHVMLDGVEVVRFDYGEDGDREARNVRRLVTAANRALKAPR